MIHLIVLVGTLSQSPTPKAPPPSKFREVTLDVDKDTSLEEKTFPGTRITIGFSSMPPYSAFTASALCEKKVGFIFKKNRRTTRQFTYSPPRLQFAWTGYQPNKEDNCVLATGIGGECKSLVTRAAQESGDGVFKVRVSETPRPDIEAYARTLCGGDFGNFTRFDLSPAPRQAKVTFSFQHANAGR